jgi:Rps23 Pro-64 3,4-dihydroxylase Tpa1-like proline 4-hydroxylase
MVSVVSPVCDHASDDVFSNLPENIATHLSANGYVICDNAIDNIFLNAVIQDTIGVEKHMKDGEISTGLTKDRGKRRARGDKIVWLPSLELQNHVKTENYGNNETALKTAPRYLLQLQNKFEHLRKTILNKYLSENNYHQTDYCSYMLAMYPEDGQGYVKHKDSTGEQPGRKLTAICYLNSEYKSEHGGALKLWPRTNKDEKEVQPVIIKPIGGRLVIFHSDMWHEVLPSFHRRIACTAWLVNRNDLKLEIISEERDQQLANLMKRIALRKLGTSSKHGIGCIR